MDQELDRIMTPGMHPAELGYLDVLPGDACEVPVVFSWGVDGNKQLPAEHLPGSDVDPAFLHAGGRYDSHLLVPLIP